MTLWYLQASHFLGSMIYSAVTDCPLSSVIGAITPHAMQHLMQYMLQQQLKQLMKLMALIADWLLTRVSTYLSDFLRLTCWHSQGQHCLLQWLIAQASAVTMLSLPIFPVVCFSCGLQLGPLPLQHHINLTMVLRCTAKQGARWMYHNCLTAHCWCLGTLRAPSTAFIISQTSTLEHKKLAPRGESARLMSVHPSSQQHNTTSMTL